MTYRIVAERVSRSSCCYQLIAVDRYAADVREQGHPPVSPRAAPSVHSRMVPMEFVSGTIHGVLVRSLVRHIDDRGWLMEIYREDELTQELLPVMGYISMTNPGVARGPHEHRAQADNFAFLGPSTFKICLWDNRVDSPTHMVRQEIIAGEGAPTGIVIPPGVVHAYRNIGASPGMVVNFPNRLYAGRGKREPVDEIRHEGDPNSLYRFD